MTITNVAPAELDIAVRIYERVIQNLLEMEIYQWDNYYPDRQTIQNDIMNKQLFAGKIDGSIVSLFTLNREYDPEYLTVRWKYRTDSFIILHRFCVEPNVQNQGIGSTTIKLVEQDLKQKGIEALRLDAFSQNPFALKLYEKLGYTRAGEAEFRKGLFYLYEKK
ncbi:GNAT family N-acetyltransferase [Brucepastera parasyntrophica]|uniref:GNAT family N-acetyltransferase n=1 Tax=Brucepastera parasyntrophica TaxID=2880008 RepID=UPI00210885D9|nr:GNAT family N-acetyltransferase [Brucepastera parasyntrophica]ULQ59891.1 GNAT family N-acetyltransferase [Brucepastera parasyntrophica]